MKRREFWKFLAAVPVASVAPLVVSKETAPQIAHQGRLVIDACHLTVPSGGLQIPSGGELIMRNCYITSK